MDTPLYYFFLLFIYLFFGQPVQFWAQKIQAITNLVRHNHRHSKMSVFLLINVSLSGYHCIAFATATVPCVGVSTVVGTRI